MFNIVPKDSNERRRYGYDATPRDAVTSNNKIIAVRGELVSGDVELDEAYPNADGLGFTFWLQGGTVSEDANLVKFYYTLQDSQVLDDTCKVKIKSR